MYHLSEAISVWRVENSECLLWGFNDDAIHLVEEAEDADLSLSLSYHFICLCLFSYIVSLLLYQSRQFGNQMSISH